MRNTVLTLSGAGLLSFFLAGCGGSSAKNAPLQENLELRYNKVTTVPGRTMNSDIHITFERAEGGMFAAVETVTDKNGPYAHAPLMVDGFFRYNKVMDYNVGGFNLWMDPADLATGRVGRMDVSEGTYNGKEVYVAPWSDKMTSYYDITTGLMEGSETILNGGKSEVITRVE